MLTGKIKLQSVKGECGGKTENSIAWYVLELNSKSKGSSIFAVC